MKLPASSLGIVLSSAVISGSFALLLQAQDMVAVGPNLCKVRLDNEWVRVTEVCCKAGEKMPLHSHPGYLSYYFTSGKPTGKKAPAGADPVKVASDTYKVVLDNEHVRLLEVRGKTGTKIPMHAHPAYAAYAVNDMKAEFVDSTGKTQQVDEKAGETIWKEPETHAVNIQSADARVLVVELKH